ncbi:hypothetical protein T4D_16433 [Trichinella pseudospiralis]|uniref:Uncharacterized protein n=1 Tax=Trichinella pseudospiralis TaxID=6337 RepID=A0A0V1FRK4_TRIPS|nr:hypothetical protein T4D_16433 [Trichinella pseudospiralis]
MRSSNRLTAKPKSVVTRKAITMARGWSKRTTKWSLMYQRSHGSRNSKLRNKKLVQAPQRTWVCAHNTTI